MIPLKQSSGEVVNITDYRVIHERLEGSVGMESLERYAKYPDENIRARATRALEVHAARSAMEGERTCHRAATAAEGQ